MPRITRILHPTDFSQHSGNAFEVACALAHDLGASLLVLHVIDPPVVGIAGKERLPVPKEISRDALEIQLRKVQAPDRGIGIEHRFAEGEPAAMILKVARETPCDMIVMGTHGRTGLQRLLMGSIAEAVLRNAECPVLTVKIPFDN